MGNFDSIPSSMFNTFAFGTFEDRAGGYLLSLAAVQVVLICEAAPLSLLCYISDHPSGTSPPFSIFPDPDALQCVLIHFGTTSVCPDQNGIRAAGSSQLKSRIYAEIVFRLSSNPFVKNITRDG